MLEAVAVLGTDQLREGYADLAETGLHYVEAGEGPMVVLLHGFSDLERVVRLPDASHWVQHDEPERVNQLLTEFLR
jgi:pimeloyl-ACP methyl ester carboxylesterase